MMDRAEFDSLTPTERKVLRLVVPGRTTAMIAAELGIAPGTVETHIKRARAKLGGVDRVRAGAALRAFEAPTQSLDTPPLDTGLGMDQDWRHLTARGSDRSLVIDRHELREAPAPFEFEPEPGREAQKGRVYDRQPLVSIALIAVTIVALVVAIILAVSLSESAQSLARTIFKQR